jgi:quercetin dioxygenase-like cupin family protein
MDPIVKKWSEVPFDTPVPGLDRNGFAGDHMYVAKVFLHPGCEVKVHSHPSEQMSIIVSGRIKWFLGEERREVEVTGGHVLHLPSNYPHGVIAIEETLIYDILSPVGPMGVDSQKSD